MKDKDENDAYLMPYFLRTALQYFCTLIFITIDLAVALSYSLVHKYIKIIQSIKIHHSIDLHISTTKLIICMKKKIYTVIYDIEKENIYCGI